MIEHRHKSILAAAIGFLLVAAIAGITFSRPLFQKKETDKKNESALIKRTNEPAESKHELTADDLADKIAKKEKLSIIDIRDKESFNKEHLLDSRNYPLEEISYKFPAINKDWNYVLIGTDGLSSRAAAEIFAANSVKNVLYLQGGFPEWKARNKSTISFGDPNSFLDQAKVNYLTSDQAKELMEKESIFIFIDLRSPEKYAESRIKGAANVFIENLESRRNEIPLGKKIILYDNNGLWAFQAAVRMFDMGFSNVFCLADGFDTWIERKYPTEK
ncbi:MAG TPA: hypothetical protein DIT25_04015 [Candidatus Moranbacteria bacterium]|nr:hypothetical protein [Candidatus Moranbacteria bacterium]